jgi:hypothetical protein
LQIIVPTGAVWVPGASRKCSRTCTVVRFRCMGGS